MYWTYLRRELAGRKKQTIIVAVGLAVANRYASTDERSEWRFETRPSGVYSM